MSKPALFRGAYLFSGTDTPTKSLFSPLLTLTLAHGQGVAVLLVELLAKLRFQRLATAVLVIGCTEVPVTF